MSHHVSPVVTAHVTEQPATYTVHDTFRTVGGIEATFELTAEQAEAHGHDLIAAASSMRVLRSVDNKLATGVVPRDLAY